MTKKNPFLARLYKPNRKALARYLSELEGNRRQQQHRIKIEEILEVKFHLIFDT